MEYRLRRWSIGGVQTIYLQLEYMYCSSCKIKKAKCIFRIIIQKNPTILNIYLAKLKTYLEFDGGSIPPSFGC